MCKYCDRTVTKKIVYEVQCDENRICFHGENDCTCCDHRLTLRIPQWLMNKIDRKRHQRVGSISRNLWILEQLEQSCK